MFPYQTTTPNHSNLVIYVLIKFLQNNNYQNNFSAFGIYTPMFCITQLVQKDKLDAKILLLQTYLGLGWLLGCAIFGFLSVHNGAECRISKQYLCQASLLMCGLCILALTGVNQNFEGYVMFVWIYGKAISKLYKYYQ